jgi:CelD/BcsL family acetyltransferase involved in cellulose biosynthesis
MRTEPSGEQVEPIDTYNVNPLTDPVWDELVTSHPDSTVFHTSAWARVLADTYGHQPCYLRLSFRGEPLALVPMMEVRSLFTGARGICLPFSDSCAPLLLSRFGTNMIAGKLRQIGREHSWSYFEVRDRSILPKGSAASESYWSHKLDLTKDRTVLPSNFRGSARRALRKAKRCGLSVNIRTDAEAMNQFYALHLRTRRKHGVPPQPRTFFSNIHKHIIEASLGFIITVEKAEHPIAAAMFFRLGHHAIYKFGASDPKWQEFRPNNLAMAEAINSLAASSVRTLHFGRTDKDNEGLRRFKLSWGAEEEEISYGKFSLLCNTWIEARKHRSTLHKHFFRALPTPMNRLAGVLLYPHLD